MTEVEPVSHHTARRAWGKLGITVVLAIACGRDEPEPGGPGPDCSAVLAVARRAAACDPTLSSLATRLADAPDEEACRRAARGLIDPEPAVQSRIRSVFEPERTPTADPLSPGERKQLDALPMPAFVVITPDVAPGPGVASTVARIGGLQLQSDAQGRLRTGVAPGARSLRLEHAGQSSEYCVELRPCKTLTVTAHGAKLARHSAIRPGPC